MALNNIKSKEELNVIDQRLLNVMNQFDDSDEDEEGSSEENRTGKDHAPVAKNTSSTVVYGEGDSGI